MASFGVLPQEVYDLVTSSVPVVCVDVIPVDQTEEEPKLGVIIRATGPEVGKLAIIGGRILKDETISSSIGRHLLDTLGESEFEFFTGNSEDYPFCVTQYKHAPTSDQGYDPTKHSIALNYLISISEPINVGNEATSFRWITPAEIPDASAYNHHLVLRKAVRFIVSASRN